MRTRSALLAGSLLLVVVACAGDEAELAALRSELQERRDHELALEERLDALDTDLAATRAELERVASRDQLTEVAADVGDLDDAVHDLTTRLTTATAALEELEAALVDEVSARAELRAHVEVVADELGGAIAAMRGSVQALEGETARVADQLDALRDRVDVIQRQAQQGGAR